jgi:hypothetical protein
LTFSSEKGDNNLGANCKCTPKLLKGVKFTDLPVELHKLHHPVPKLHKLNKSDMGNKEAQTLFDKPISHDISAYSIDKHIIDEVHSVDNLNDISVDDSAISEQ